MAEDLSERNHWVTIDVGLVEFETAGLSVTVLDADFGISLAAVALLANTAFLVIEAAKLFLDRGQTGTSSSVALLVTGESLTAPLDDRVGGGVTCCAGHRLLRSSAFDLATPFVLSGSGSESGRSPK
jgi:hypothetical protein